MSDPTAEDDLDALRAEIERAGQAASRSSAGTHGRTVVLGSILLALYVALPITPTGVQLWGYLLGFAGFMFVNLREWRAGRRAYRNEARRLRQQIHQPDDPDTRRFLSRLALFGHGHTEAIARELLDELRRPNEVAPAETPDGRGAEVSAGIEGGRRDRAASG